MQDAVTAIKLVNKHCIKRLLHMKMHAEKRVHGLLVDTMGRIPDRAAFVITIARRTTALDERCLTHLAKRAIWFEIHLICVFGGLVNALLQQGPFAPFR